MAAQGTMVEAAIAVTARRRLTPRRDITPLARTIRAATLAPAISTTGAIMPIIHAPAHSITVPGTMGTVHTKATAMAAEPISSSFLLIQATRTSIDLQQLPLPPTVRAAADIHARPLTRLR